MAEIVRREMFKNEYLTPLAYGIMDLYIQGLMPKEIGERLNKHPHYVSKIINAPNFQHMLSIRRAQISDEIDERVINSEKEATDVLKAHAKETAEKMVKLLDAESEGVQLRAAADILDRVGPQKRQKGAEVSATVVMIDAEAAVLIKETAEMIKED